MIRVLVPIEAFTRLTLSAIYFALEFAKRHPARIIFLMVGESGPATGESVPAESGHLSAATVFQQLLEQARQQQVDVAVHHSQEAYLTAVRRVAADQGIDDLIIAVPPAGDPEYPRLQRRLEQLRHQVPCHIITVKPKEAGPLGLAPKPVKSPS